jgi:hypothetical protein
MSVRTTSPRSSLDWAGRSRTGQKKADRTRLRLVPPDPTPMSENLQPVHVLFGLRGAFGSEQATNTFPLVVAALV